MNEVIREEAWIRIGVVSKILDQFGLNTLNYKEENCDTFQFLARELSEIRELLSKQD